MHPPRQWCPALLIGSVLGVSALAFTAAGAIRPPPPPPGPAVQAPLIRQDFSDCNNGNVSANDPSLIGGTVQVVRLPDGNSSVKVAVTGTPNTTYHFFLKCVKQLGDIKTGDEGEGVGNFEFPTNSVGSVYGFDMYPEGAPAGNKYQSVQIRFQ
jgi:hypothetical protein